MRRRILACILVVLMLVSVLPPGLAAEAAGKAVFESTAPDADGVFTVTLTLSNVNFRTFQFALRYDPTVLQPVKESGEPAAEFRDFAGRTDQAWWMSTVGLELDAKAGLIGFTGFIMPGTEDETPVVQYDENYGSQAILDKTGLPLFTFRFKRLKDGDTGLQLATAEKGEPYQPSCATGVLLSGDEGQLPLDVTFRDAAGTGETESHAPGTPAAPKTVDGLLKEAVILKIGSHAAVVKGNAAAIYPGERAVTAYAHDNRTFVPVRFVGERLGAEVGWEGDSQTATVTKDGHVIRMPIGSAVFTLDGEEKALDAPAELTPSTEGNFRTMVPIRFVSEALGYQVEWDQARNLVIIAPKSLNWDSKGEVEAQAMDTAVMTLTLYSNFV